MERYNTALKTSESMKGSQVTTHCLVLGAAPNHIRTTLSFSLFLNEEEKKRGGSRV